MTHTQKYKRTKVKSNVTKLKSTKTMGGNTYMVKDTNIYREEDGRVLEDTRIREVFDNGVMSVQGYDNGRPINYTKVLEPSYKMAKSRQTKRKNKTMSKRK